MRNLLRFTSFLIALFVVVLFAVPRPVQAAEPDWRVRYWNNTSFSGSYIERRVPEINFDWGIGSPISGINADQFSARFRRSVNFAAGTYRFTATSDDGMRVWVDDVLIIDMWRDQPPTTRTADHTLTAGDHVIRVDYYENGGGAVVRLNWSLVTSGSGAWTGNFFNNTDLSGSPVLTQNTDRINYDWGLGSPGAGVNADNFSARWTRTANFTAGTWRFTATTDDGVRVYLNGVRIIDAWYDHPPQTFTADVPVGAGNQTLTVEYYERGGGAVAKFSREQIGSVSGWSGQYFNNKDLAGGPVMQRVDSEINFDWGGGGPGGGVPNDSFSARWSRTVNFNAGTYRFTATGDDGMRVYLNGVKILDMWYDHPITTVTADVAVGAGNQNLVVEYYEHGGGAIAKFSWAAVGGGSGWSASYYNNVSLAGTPVLQRTDANLNFNWGYGSPHGSVSADNFSARWTQTVYFNAGTYRFSATADDGVRVWVDGTKIIDIWYDHPAITSVVDVPIGAGNHTIKVEYYERGGAALVALSWAPQ